MPHRGSNPRLVKPHCPSSHTAAACESCIRAPALRGQAPLDPDALYAVMPGMVCHTAPTLSSASNLIFEPLCG